MRLLFSYNLMESFDLVPGEIKNIFSDSRSEIVTKMTRFVKILVVLALQAHMMGVWYGRRWVFQ